MTTKFVECTLGVKYRDVGEDGQTYGGPMYYLVKGLKEIGAGRLGKILAVVFAVMCVGASFGGGNALQSNQAVAQLTTTMGIEGSFVKTLFGLGLALLVGVVIIGGIRRIGQITEKLVPFMGIVYLLGSLAVVTVHYQYIGEAIGLIVGQAFSPAAGLGGMVGVLITGFRRACFSNEAGIGSAAIAHSAVKTRYPASEGLVALWEPFVDTVVICTLTALTIIFFSEGVFTYGIQDQWGKVVVGDGGQVVGTASTLDSVFKFSDAMILAMAFPNMIGLFLLAPKARKELGRYLDAIGLRKKE